MGVHQRSLVRDSFRAMEIRYQIAALSSEMTDSGGNSSNPARTLANGGGDYGGIGQRRAGVSFFAKAFLLRKRERIHADETTLTEVGGMSSGVKPCRVVSSRSEADVLSLRVPAKRRG